MHARNDCKSYKEYDNKKLNEQNRCCSKFQKLTSFLLFVFRDFNRFFFSSNKTLLFYMSVQVAFRFDESTSFSNYSNFDIKLKINSQKFIIFQLKHSDELYCVLC